MSFSDIYFSGLLLIITAMVILWIASIAIRNVSIVDLFWGPGFILASGFYFFKTDGFELRKVILNILVVIWGLRLSGYLALRNIGKGEDFRYKVFREKYGKNRYWWISLFQTFLLQGILMWLISAPLLGAQFYSKSRSLESLDIAGLILWIIGFCFEAGGDFQLAVFKANPTNKDKVLDKGFWRYTRHPNYFGDSAVWWGYAFFCLAAGSYLPAMGSLLMTVLIIKVSGLTLLEKSLKKQKSGYAEYAEKTSAFIPWFPKK